MERTQKVHFVAIGGQGMSGIARILLKRGYRVSGSDLKESQLTDLLRREGADVFIGHREENVCGADIVVLSSAIAETNPEVVAARRLGIPVVHRVDMLISVIRGKRVLAVAGAHGKTTTTAMLAWILLKTGRDPVFLVGGEIPGEGNSRDGGGPDAVVETDESDGSFLRIPVDLAVVTNIDDDHLDYWGSVEGLERAFGRFVESAAGRGKVVYNADDPRLSKLLSGRHNCLGYSLSDAGLFRAEEVIPANWGSRSRLVCDGRTLGTLELSVPGRHNVQDALAAFVAVRELYPGDDGSILQALKTFPGVKRRLERIGLWGGVLVLDDFAHHPSEIRASLGAVREALPQARVLVLYQPHRYSRTRLLKDEFGPAFSQADYLVVTDIYSGPGERPDAGVDGSFICEAVGFFGRPEALYVPDMYEAAAVVASKAGPGDVLITMGAGDISKTHVNLAEALEGRRVLQENFSSASRGKTTVSPDM